MNLKEFTRIIDLHGSESARWPKRLRGECGSLVANNVQARMLLNQQWQIDESMAKLEVPNFPGLETRVLNQPLPETIGASLKK